MYKRKWKRKGGNQKACGSQWKVLEVQRTGWASVAQCSRFSSATNGLWVNKSQST